MERRSRRILFVIVILLSGFYTYLGTAIDTITASQPIRDPETITSNGSAFILGFFNPGISSNRYVGIWYQKKSQPVVWVANRNKPLNDASGLVTISEDGNLVVLNGQKEVLWSSNVSNSVNNVSAQLLDTGNLVLRDITTGIGIWESFQEPTDTYLAGMELSSHMRTGPIVQLRSWKSPSDPSPGNFSLGIGSSSIPETIIWNDSQVYWRTGPWNGQSFIGIPNMDNSYIDGITVLANSQTGIVNFSFPISDPPIFIILTSLGIAEQRVWDDEKNDWVVSFGSRKTECDVYGWCGGFGNCNPQKTPICSCLRGFEPMNMEEWSRGNWTNGCFRKKPLQCERINQTGEVAKQDGFLKLEMMKVPYFVERSPIPVENCSEHCLNNCSCIAYAYAAGIGCMTWTRSLIDLQKFPSGGADLYIRLAHTELEKDNKVVVIVPLVAGIITCAICTFFLWRWIAKHKERWNAGEESSEQSQKRCSINYVTVTATEGCWMPRRSMWRKNLVLLRIDSHSAASPDTITASQPIRDPETIISNGSAFILGFFSPGNSSNCYVGIWYNKKSDPIVWVANRNKPLNDASGVVTISEDGNLVVLNGQNEVLWSSNVSNSVTNVSAQLLDSGNLVLRDITTGISIWESFQEPTDTFLAGMELSSRIGTGPIVQLRSWRSPSDPSPGRFSFGIGSSNIPEDGRTGVNFSYLFPNESVFFVISSQGILEQINWVDETNNWEVSFWSRETECDVYGWCGAFGSCNPQRNLICSSLRGFEPKNIHEWNRGNWTNGCVRKRPLLCERMNQTGEAKEDWFLKLEMMKLPYFAERFPIRVENCSEYCLNNRSCIAYAYDAGIGCMTWTGNLIDLQKFPSGGADLYIRLARSELEKDNKVVIIVPVVVGMVTFGICTFFLWRRMAKHGERRNAGEESSEQSQKRCSINYVTVTTVTEDTIRDPETITSNGSAFILGIFNPGNSSNHYVGIWYNNKTEPVVWVANRNKPLNDESGKVTISDDGNLVVLNGQKEVLWSSNVSNSVANVSAQLLDSGNLVLRDITTGIGIWESFQEPTDTFLAGMELSSHVRTGPIVQLRSWKSPSDPSPGSFSFGIGSSNIPEGVIWNDSNVYWRTGPWNGQIFIGLPYMYSSYLDGFKLLADGETGNEMLQTY
ncbi:hypothetical protein EZV62_025371 [Acer yangbiense]|uniref:Bulb-type lectin domain-containing protein n=1 Tax=Acer yangbiense TaxID=1000413 RepID=A0A5C7GZM9_9ROSI|nr:hypothetical protein EZV62_025371 [Acer yangbiense]